MAYESTSSVMNPPTEPAPPQPPLPEPHRPSTSFDCHPDEHFTGVFEPQRKSCEVRVRNTLRSLFNQDDETNPCKNRDSASSSAKSSVQGPVFESKEEEDQTNTENNNKVGEIVDEAQAEEEEQQHQSRRRDMPAEDNNKEVGDIVEAEEEKQQQHQSRPQELSYSFPRDMAAEDLYTNDGTVDICNNRANRNKTGNWKACLFVHAYGCCERIAYYGISTHLVTYLVGRLRVGVATALKYSSVWQGTCFATPLVGAFLADSYMGRYWTIALFSIIYAFGLGLLSWFASTQCKIESCHQDIYPSKGQVQVSFLALYFIAIGIGGIQPCVSSFGADQFDDTDEAEKKKKSSFFNWFDFSTNVGALIGSSFLVWMHIDFGWGWGFGAPTIVMVLAIMFFFVGSKLYRLQKPGGNPLIRICQVVVASCRKATVEVPADKYLLYETVDEESSIQGSRKLESTNELRFFDKAAVETPSDRVKSSPSRWSLCTVTQVEELKSIIKLLPIWATGIVFASVYGQMSTTFVLQGSRMDPHIGPFMFPSAFLNIFDLISITLWAPVYDRIIIPCARKLTGHEQGFTQLQRMGVGLVISIFAVITAGILEVIRLELVRKNNYYNVEYIPMSLFWQIPQYFLIGCAKDFTFIGQLEFFYDEAPDAMRSLCSVLALTTVSFGHYLSATLVMIVTKVTTKHGQPTWIPDDINKGHLDYFYWLLAILSFINFIVYLWIANWYTCKKTTGMQGDKIKVNAI